MADDFDPHFSSDRATGREPLPEISISISDEDAPKAPFKDSDGDVQQELPDGSLVIRFGGRLPRDNDPKAHDANLADFVDSFELSRISMELMEGINADLQSRQQWIDDCAEGIKILGTRIENPSAPNATADIAVVGQSVVRSPILLDCTLRFQATARGELLPAEGPVKVANTSPPKSQREKQIEQAYGAPAESEVDLQAEALQKDMNFYLTAVDREYYPDTTRMFFKQGYCGSGFKKVYRCPVRRRPISRSVDADDLIVSDNEVSLEDAGRVTHRIIMRQAQMKRLQLAGHYSDIELGQPAAPDPDAVASAEADAGGMSLITNLPRDYKHTVYECYCELDIEGFEHPDGMPLPYRVSIDKTSEKILEIRRRWKEGDDRYLGHMPFVKYSFIDAISFYGLGLLHLVGNATNAVTSIWRLAIDAGTFASWPAFLYADTISRQDSNVFRVPPGSGRKVNVGALGDIRKAIMELPFHDVSAGLMTMMQHIEETGQRVGQSPEIMVGEGRQDVPVGTTLAMLDQAVKVLDSVHKGMHSSQAQEFMLLRDLLREDPDALHCNNPDPAWRWERAALVQALENCRLVPMADPNTPSHTIRIMKAVAMVQLYQLAPDKWNFAAFVDRMARMIGLGETDTLMAPPPPPAPPDLKSQAAMIAAQAKIHSIQQKTTDSAQKLQLQSVHDALTRELERLKLMDKQAERLSKEKIAAMDVSIEQMKLRQAALEHQDKTAGEAEQFRHQQRMDGLQLVQPPRRIM